MKTVTQNKEDIKNLMAKIAEFDATAVAVNRDLTDAEVQMKNEMLDTVEEINKMVQTLERQEKVQSYLAEPQRKTVENGKKTTYQVGDDNRKKDRFNSLGEQMACIMRAGLPGGSVDPRLFNAATGSNETVPSDGGFLVQQDFSGEILKQVYDTAVIASRV